jgi:transcription elongation factor Elf1
MMDNKKISIKKIKRKNKIEQERKCNKCGSAEKVYGMLYTEGTRIEKRLVCLNCGAGMPGFN